MQLVYSFVRCIRLFTFGLLMLGCSSGGTLTISPTSGGVGTVITITGTDFSEATSVKVGGTSALILSASATSLQAFVMPGSSTGSVTVTAPSSSEVSAPVGSGKITTTTTKTFTSSSSFTVASSSAPLTQQGSALVGTGNSGAAHQGFSVSLSADGNTAAVGGYNDNSGLGAVWIFTRSGTTWTQQGSKLVGTSAVGASNQGVTVALSADGNTLAVGGANDDPYKGAGWVFVRSGSEWSQQAKLIGSNSVGNSFQGGAIAISADGNTIALGGPADNSDVGAVWIFTRSGTTWTQQGSKLVGTGATGAANQATTIALSADGKTLLSGGASDNSSVGATWVFTRDGDTWTQQGEKLVGTGATGTGYQGGAVALSADGNTAVIGAAGDNSSVGAVWVFTRSGTTWTQQGSKLTATGETGAGQFGYTVSVSADGNTFIAGGNQDNSDVGAAWIFTRSDSSWSQSGNKRVASDNVGAAKQGSFVAISADGNTAIVGGEANNSSGGGAWVYVP